MRRVLTAVAAILMASSAAAQLFPSLSRNQSEQGTILIEEPARPDPVMTPGAADLRVDLSEICDGTTKRRRPPSTKLCDQVFAAYSIPPGDRYQYECDHDIPVALGGLTVAANLWPQPNVEAARKYRLEVEMQRRACVAYRTLTPENAAKVLAEEQREIADDWVAAERRYLSPRARRYRPIKLNLISRRRACRSARKNIYEGYSQ